jgi:predicted nucleotidyltransferase component of viral defense system
MRLLDAAGVPSSDWTFGGGTVLMLRHHHRVSKDIDIFLDDPQWLGYFNPEISDVADEIADFAIADRRFLKLYCPEGEIDFIVAGNVSHNPVVEADIFGRTVRAETTTEIVAKKLVYRAVDFTARDLFDLSLALHADAEGMEAIQALAAPYAPIILTRTESNRERFEEDYQAIITLDWHPSFDDCFAACRRWLELTGLQK